MTYPVHMMYQQQPVWVSNSSITDAMRCPRLYYLKNIYKNRRGKKIAITSPPLTLGLSVHEVLEPLAKTEASKRFMADLTKRYEEVWHIYTGLRGGFSNESEEDSYFQRGKKMIQRVVDNPGPLLAPALRLSSPDDLPPRFYLSKDENILLCGKIDWIEYLPVDDSVHIIDFKTGKYDEDVKSLQLPIYCLLVKNLQKREVKKVSYWYLDRDDKPCEMPLPDLDTAEKTVLDLALTVKKMREEKQYQCRGNGCKYCHMYESIAAGKGKLVATVGYQDIYMADPSI